MKLSQLIFESPDALEHALSKFDFKLTAQVKDVKTYKTKISKFSVSLDYSLKTEAWRLYLPYDDDKEIKSGLSSHTLIKFLNHVTHTTFVRHILETDLS